MITEQAADESSGASFSAFRLFWIGLIIPLGTTILLGMFFQYRRFQAAKQARRFYGGANDWLWARVWARARARAGYPKSE